MVTNIGQYLKHQSQKLPNSEAFSDETESVSFKELDRMAENIAFRIQQSIDNKSNVPIIVFSDKSVRAVASFMGILYSGNYYVALDVKMPIARLKNILNVLDADVAIASEKQSKILQEAGFLGICLIQENLAGETSDENFTIWTKGITDTDPAYILFTSGSTGMPKGVVVSHKAVIDYIEWQCNTFMFNQSNILGNQAPFYFDASMPDLFTPICSGASMKIIPEKLFLFPNKLIDFVNQNGINTLIWVPSALIMLTDNAYFISKKMEALRLVMFCGEVMPNKHLNIWRKFYENVVFVNLYGPTEAAYACSYYVVNRQFRDNESLPIGVACENTKIVVLGDEGCPVDEGEVGELYIGGSCLASGYYNNSEKTEQAFIQNPLNHQYVELVYCTGDLVKYNVYGELEFVGRKDFQIKHMGYRIELGEIETATYCISQIERCCALYDVQNKKIVLYCVAAKKITEKTVYTNIKDLLPRYMLPSIIKIVDYLPLNANGKIDRSSLMEQYNKELGQ